MVYTHYFETMAEGHIAGDSVVLLQPFPHQVGGHTRMHLLDPSTICKPLIARELNFYLNIPKEMEQFTPHFKGVIQVNTIDNTNVVQLKNVSKSGQNGHRNFNVDKDLDKKNKKSKRSSSNDFIRVKICEENSLMFGKHNNREMSSVRYFDDYRFKTSKQSNVHYFLLLENVASHFYRPCVLDLKMGTRQHGDDAPEEKRHRQIAKCAASTSANLGVRLCGMQVYQADVGIYLWKDKYYGRTLDEEGFKHSLYQFFHNGFQLRDRVMRTVVEKLKQLRAAVEQQNSFRFFSSSLLILYEGCDTKEFNHCDDLCSDSESEACQAWGYESQNQNYSSGFQNSDGESDSLLESSSESDMTSINSPNRSHFAEERRPQVEVRMIDFAHTTHEGYVGDSLVHRGPDKGYLAGLDSLIRLLLEIIAEEDDRKHSKQMDL